MLSTLVLILDDQYITAFARIKQDVVLLFFLHKLPSFFSRNLFVVVVNIVFS